MAHRVKVQRDPLAGEIGDNNNLRVKRYVAKYTIDPVLTYGIAHEAGSVGSGKLAGLVLWSSAFSGVEPATVVKGGVIIYASMNDIDALIPTLQPAHYRMMSGALGAMWYHTRLTFISQIADAQNILRQLSLQSTIVVVKSCRTVRGIDMIRNGLQPDITVDTQTYKVHIDGELTANEPADILPMA